MTARAVQVLLQRADAYEEDARFLEERKPLDMKPTRDSTSITLYRAMAGELRNIAEDVRGLTETQETAA